MKMKIMSPEEERKALKELLDAAVTRSDAGSIAPRSLPSESMFMLMLLHLKAKLERASILKTLAEDGSED